jgi:hypothetical protein
MRIASRFLVLLFLAALVVPAPALAAPLSYPEVLARDRVDSALFGEALRAAGIERGELRFRYEDSFRSAVGRLQEETGRPKSAYRLAQRLYDLVRRMHLRTYEPAADGLDAVLDRGAYNCLSASLFYGIAARAFGLEARIVEVPRHVFIRLEIDGRDVDVEMTSPRGFDFRPRLDRVRRWPESSVYGSAGDAGFPEGTAALPVSEATREHVVDLELGVAFVWHNAGRRALEQGESVTGALRFLEESRLQPDLVARSEYVASALARAFRQEYELGNFDAAYRVAEVELQIFSERTSARDRLLAAALKRIEAAAEAGDPARAEAILDEAAAALGSRSDLARLERGTCPLLAAAAVRGSDWDRAVRLAERFARARPDPVEAARLMAWIEFRRGETETPGGACGREFPGWIVAHPGGVNLAACPSVPARRP